MKITGKYILLAAALITTSSADAGNKDRAGQMGATELNVNPWASTSALFYSNGASVTGIEAMKLNVAGLARTKGTELGVSWNNYMQGTDINFVNGAVAIDVGSDNKLGVNIMSFNFGTPYVSTVEAPEQDVTFAPSFVNIGIAYSHEFSENVVAGLQGTVLTESMGDARANGFALDAGIQYQGGTNNNTHFGVSLRNVGPTFKFKGDGFNTQTEDVNGNTNTTQIPSGNINLPTQFILSAAYDFYPGHSSSEDFDVDSVKHRITPTFAFTSNAYYADHIALGTEYALNNKFFLRAAYRFENRILNSDRYQTMYRGLSAGLGLNFFLDKVDRAQPLQFDYGFRLTRFNTGQHSLSIKYTIN